MACADDQAAVDQLFAGISPSERWRLLVLLSSRLVEINEGEPLRHKSAGYGPGVEPQTKTLNAVAGGRG